MNDMGILWANMRIGDAVILAALTGGVVALVAGWARRWWTRRKAVAAMRAKLDSAFGSRSAWATDRVTYMHEPGGRAVMRKGSAMGCSEVPATLPGDETPAE